MDIPKKRLAASDHKEGFTTASSQTCEKRAGGGNSALLFLPSGCVPVEAEGGPCAGGGYFCASSSRGAETAGSDGHNARVGSLLPLTPMLGAGAKQGKLPWGSKWEMLGMFSNSPCAGSDICNLFELVLHQLPSLRELFLSGLSAQ